MESPAEKQSEAAPMPAGAEVLEFDAYRLDLKRRRLLRGDQPFPIGGRQLSILIVLAQRLGKIVSKRELHTQIWPSSIVEDGTLRVHMAALQKTLGKTQEGQPFIENIPSHGYRLAIPVTPHARALSTGGSGRELVSVSAGTPARPRERGLIGRQECIAHLVSSLGERRLVTVTGPGGLGKTAVALEVAEELAPDYPDRVWTVDLTAAPVPDAVLGVVAASLGVTLQASDGLNAVLDFLKLRSGLLVLDNCEHVLQAAAVLAQAILQSAGRVRVLVTSREQLYVQGEWVYRLKPLEVPQGSGPWTRAQLSGASAVELFLRRAGGCADMELSEQDLGAVVEICRRLEGNALAIEIMAARLDLLGLPGLLAALDRRHHLSIVGHRSRVARHWTLGRSLDWSYGLLSQVEQRVFRHLGLCHGSFTLEAAAAAWCTGSFGAEGLFEVILSLAGKSLLSCETVGEELRYRLHDVSRCYAQEKLRECGELTAALNRQARMIWDGARPGTCPEPRGGMDRALLFSGPVRELPVAMRWDVDIVFPAAC
jgi:predicted ATPase/DNA-binding winged helix-turn-helix (wHTH) protein